MIDELAFSRTYGWFWRSMTPMSEAYVRQINLGLSERVFRAMPGEAAAVKRAFVNELGFCAFRDMASGSWRAAGWVRPGGEILEIEMKEVWRRIGRLEGRAHERRLQVDERDIREALRLASRLQRYFVKNINLVIEPTFPGCGIVEECQGDVFADGVLFEVKSGGRPFRSADLRQILTYLALNHASGYRWPVESVCILNPRVGIEISRTVEELCFGLSGMEASQLLDSIVYEMSRADASR